MGLEEVLEDVEEVEDVEGVEEVEDVEEAVTKTSSSSTTGETEWAELRYYRQAITPCYLTSSSDDAAVPGPQ